MSESEEQLYYSVGSQEGLDKYNQAMASYDGYTRFDNGTYNRVGYDMADYEDQRPCEAIPVLHHDIMREAERLYDQVGLVRNMIDLMTDFTLQGLRVVHPQKAVEKFYQNWFSRVNGLDRSDRFCSNLYKFGNAIVKRRWATLNKSTKKNIRRAKAQEVPFEDASAPRRRIPSRYIFLNPSTVDVLGGEIACFVGGRKLRYGLKLPCTLASKGNMNDPITQELMEQVPEDMKQAVSGNGMSLVPLDQDDTIVFHYKKEDWHVWSKPIMYGVFRNIRTLEKLNLADLTALDGAVDRVRVFKLGDIENKIMPGPAAYTKLANLLKANVGAGTRNILWTQDLTIEESKSDVSAFLGEEKYRPTMNAIYAGLGIPPSLTGTNEVGGTTNNLVSLKSLIDRLDYVRNKLIEFWSYEFELVRQSMGFQKAAVLEFDQNNLGDEEAEKKLFIDLADRDIVPYEFVQRKFGLDPEVQSGKVEHEWKERKRKARVGKASPFHKPEFENELKKSLLDRGQITPSEVGLELDPRKPGEKTNLIPLDVGGPPNSKTSKPPQKGGRPTNSRDAVQRKRRRFTPVEKAVEIWATGAQEKIAAIANPIILSKFGKKNMRSLTSEQFDAAEKIKFGILFNLKASSEVTEESVGKAALSKFPAGSYREFEKRSTKVEELIKRSLTVGELHSIQVEVYLDGVLDEG